MSVTDLTADMLTMIRNASSAKKDSVMIKSSNVLLAISDILKKEGFIENYQKVEDNKQGIIKVFLKYTKKNTAVLKGLKRISTPRLRNYTGYKDIKKVIGGVGISIISTSSGIMTGYEARSKNIGGEVICYAW
ncbi:MAG: 30S ribosomal protein S8 [Candidatus Omnitrophica bacterium]|nr:30S ribosomal protein S8 [Candidatus Omnitrophota bacterium]